MHEIHRLGYKVWKLIRSLFISLRPNQWKKNFLVFLAPLASGTITQSEVLITTFIVFFVFTLASSSIYLVNDVIDVEFDRLHPMKKGRPIASGLVRPSLAISLSVTLATSSLYMAYVHLGREVLLVLLSYQVIQLLYVLELKHKPVLDLMCVSSGFVLRAAAGALASDIGISGFFLIVIGASAMFVVTGKRFSELKNSSPRIVTRPSLQIYSLEYLRFIWVVCVAITLTFYALWAMEIGRNDTSFSTAYSFIPFAIAIFRYAQNVDSGIAEAPEDMIRNDRVILWSAIIWLAFFLYHHSVI